MNGDVAPRNSLQGAFYAFAAFLFWGFVPIYWKELAHVPPLETILHRILWSGVLLGLILARQKRWPEALRALRDPATARTMAATTLLIGSNWFLFIWAVNSGHLLEASLGYFVTPLINVALGMMFLGERLNGRQTAALALAAIGLANLLLAYGKFPALALSLAVTFALYGLLRKSASVDALVGLSIETMILAAPSAAALLILGLKGKLFFLGETRTAGLLLGTAVVTTLPLLWFAHAARRLELKALAFAQYLSPTCHFLLAITLFKEPLTASYAATFALIWAALILYSADIALAYRRS